MGTKTQLRREDIIYPELSYEIIGALFEVYRELGSGYREKYYQNAVAIQLKKQKIKFQEQLFVPLYFKNEKIGNLFMDFLIENKIVLELKKDEKFSSKHIEQVYSYLKAKKIKLGIIANFAKDGVKYKRILNLE